MDNHNLADAVNETPHNDICTDECGGYCCKMYFGEVYDSSIIQNQFKDKSFNEKVSRLLIDALTGAGYKKDDAKKEVEDLFSRHSFLFHNRLANIDNLIRDASFKNKTSPKCLFYDKNNGCGVYEVRPKICKEYVCARLEDVLKIKFFG